MVKKIIAQEVPGKPLSDEAISKMISEQGIDLARRTVAKYREMLNIPSSSQRRMVLDYLNSVKHQISSLFLPKASVYCGFTSPGGF